MKGHSEKNQNQPTKILLYSFEDPAGLWEADGTDWYRWALPVYRMPQASWDETTGFTRQKIWFIEKVFSEEPTDPNSLEFSPWLQCYWDSQAGRWVILSPGGGSGDYVTFEFIDEASASSESVSSGTMGACQYFPPGDGPKICEMMTAEACAAVGGAFNLDGITTCDSGSSVDDGLPEDCESRVPATGPFFGRVVKKSCGMDAVPGEDADGLIELMDDLGILDNRDIRDIIGRIGFAVRMKEEPSGSVSGSVEGECYWMIVIVNFWRVVQVVTDIVFGVESITIKRKNLTVWDECSLPDEIIEGTDCPEKGSGSSSGSVAP